MNCRSALHSVSHNHFVHRLDALNFRFGELLRTLALGQGAVPANDRRLVPNEDFIHVFESATRGFGVHAVDEREVGPDDYGEHYHLISIYSN